MANIFSKSLDTGTNLMYGLTTLYNSGKNLAKNAANAITYNKFTIQTTDEDIYKLRNNATGPILIEGSLKFCHISSLMPFTSDEVNIKGADLTDFVAILAYIPDEGNKHHLFGEPVKGYVDNLHTSEQNRPKNSNKAIFSLEDGLTRLETLGKIHLDQSHHNEALLALRIIAQCAILLDHNKQAGISDEIAQKLKIKLAALAETIAEKSPYILELADAETTLKFPNSERAFQYIKAKEIEIKQDPEQSLTEGFKNLEGVKGNKFDENNQEASLSVLSDIKQLAVLLGKTPEESGLEKENITQGKEHLKALCKEIVKTSPYILKLAAAQRITESEHTAHAIDYMPGKHTLNALNTKFNITKE